MNNYGITKSELHPSLLEFIGSSGGGIKFMKNSTTLRSANNEVSIGIDTFNRDKDLLLVYKNSVYLELSEDYTISLDSSKIISAEGNFSEGSVFNFIAFTNCTKLPQGEIDGSKLLSNSIGISKLDKVLADKINSLSGNDLNIDGGYFGETENEGDIVDGGEF